MSHLLQRIQRRKQHNEESGAAIVEGALVFGLFMFIILALIEFGLYFMSWSTGRNATTEGAHHAAVSGRSADADYGALHAMREQLKSSNGVRFVIIYHANTVSDKVPSECLAEAEARINDNVLTKAHGVFTEPSGVNDPDTYDWNDRTQRPLIACNIYYPYQIMAANQSNLGAFIYVRPSAGDPASTSLDRFWPGEYRIDRMNGPVDFLGVYTSAYYKSATGLLGTRPLVHNSIIQIESRSVN
jgi:TadE-like protein